MQQHADKLSSEIRNFQHNFQLKINFGMKERQFPTMITCASSYNQTNTDLCMRRDVIPLLLLLQLHECRLDVHVVIGLADA